ncbi:MAG TPA: DUF4270 family protein [Saprospiraceae bacterium]|nr:DUF4270 family protein [Saprospiraceae bacterium]
MQTKFILLLIFISAVLFNHSCNEPSIIGIDLLDGESIDTRFTDTLTFRAYTSSARPVLSSRIAARSFYTGNLNDPIFGRSEANIYFGVQRLLEIDSLAGAEIDSLVLRIAFDSLAFYGLHQEALFDLTLFRMLEGLESDSLFTDKTIILDPNPLAVSLGRKISFSDSVKVIQYANDIEVSVPPQLRLRLTNEFTQEFFTFLQNSDNDTDLQNYLKGFCLAVSNHSNAVIGFNMSPDARFGGINSLRMFYRAPGGRKYVHDLLFRTRRFTQVRHNYEGSVVQGFIEQENPPEDLLFIQGGGGIETKIDISPFLALEGKLINRAEVEITVAQEDRFIPSVFHPVTRYWCLYPVRNRFTAISDFNFIASFGEGVFGGQISEVDIGNGEKVTKLKFNITNHVQRYLKDPEGIGNTLILSSFPEGERIGRTVFYGPQHPVHRARYNVFFTNSTK